MPDTRNTGKSSDELAATLTSINKQLQTLSMDQKIMGRNLEDKVENLRTAMDQKIDELRTDIRDELSGIIQENTSRIEENSTKLQKMERKYEELENKLELAEKSMDLIVRGVPMLKDENLYNIYRFIAVAINIQPEFLPRARLYRLGRKKPGSKADPPILIKFTNRLDRMEFFGAYLRDTSLKLSNIGFSPLADTRVYLSDNLTTMSRSIFQMAWKLKAEKKIFSVKTISGKVLIRIAETDAPIAISHISELPQSS
jgi:hypothetical protein